jgi:ADP-ribosylglycohydrolase
MHAGDPDAAYHNAVNIFSAHQFSYGLEAAAVMAACVAEAARPSATVDSIAETALRLAKDGTRDALGSVIAAARNAPKGDESALQAHLRAAIEPYDTVKGGVQEFERTGAYPSQLHSIEEVPLALGFIIAAGGDFTEAVLGAVNYGRDSDSIAGMAGAIIGAMVGPRNRIDFDAAGRDLLGVFTRDYAAQQARAAARHDELTSIMRGIGA